MPYIPNTDADRAEMLAAAGFASIEVIPHYKLVFNDQE